MTAVESTALPRALPSPRSPVLGRSDLVATAGVPARTATVRALVRGVLLAGLTLAFVVTCSREGLPTDRVVLRGWVVAGVGASPSPTGAPGRPAPRRLAAARRCAARLRRQPWAGRRLGATVHVTEPAAADRGWPVAPSRRSVGRSTGTADWWEASRPCLRQPFRRDPLVLGILWVRNRARWGRYAGLVVGLLGGGAGRRRALSGGATVAGAQGRRDRAVRRLCGAGWEVLGLPRAGALLAESQGQVNPVAAVPSCHGLRGTDLPVALSPRAADVGARGPGRIRC